MRHPAFLAVAAGALGLATTFAVPASAETVLVRYSDLDLTTKAGQNRLERRIDSAAREACNMSELYTGHYTPPTDHHKYYQQAKAGAHKQVAEAIANHDRRG